MKPQTKLEFPAHTPFKEVLPVHHFFCKLVFRFLSFDLDPLRGLGKDRDGLWLLSRQRSLSSPISRK